MILTKHRFPAHANMSLLLNAFGLELGCDTSLPITPNHSQSNQANRMSFGTHDRHKVIKKTQQQPRLCTHDRHKDIKKTQQQPR